MFRLLPLAGLVIGCAGSPLSSSSIDRAVTQERETCDDKAAAALPLAPDAVEAVEPLYFVRRRDRGGEERHLVGAALRIRPPPGMTPEWLARALQCHHARVLLAKEPTTLDDPFAVPHGFVDVDVRSRGTHFLVTLQGQDEAQASAIFARARTFSAAHDRSLP